jgi:CRP-like cAMP-binding protein
VREVLEKFEILRDLSDDELESLKWFLDQDLYEDGRVLWSRSDEACELVLVLDGRVALDRDGAPLGEVGAGDMLGSACLVRIGERPYGATARGKVSVLKLSRESYLRLRNDYSHVALALQEGIVRSLSRVVHTVLPD